MDEDYDIFLQMFKEEAAEYVRNLTSCLLDLEEKPEDVKGIREGLRNAHSLKGCAQMIDLDHIATVAHAIEDAMRACESGGIILTKPAANTLLSATDLIARMVQILPQRDASHSHEALVEEIMGWVEIHPESKSDAPRSGEEILPDLEVKPEQTEEVPLQDPAEVGSDPQGPVKSPEAPTMPEGGGKSSRSSEDTIRVNIAKLDALQSLAARLSRAELQFEDKHQRCQTLLKQFKEMPKWTEARGEDREEAQSWLRDVRGNIQSLTADMGGNVLELKNLVEEIQYQTLAVRMLPFGTTTGEFRRMVRDIADELKKEVRLVVAGEDQEVDRRIIEEIRAPIMHIVRNSIDHGIEQPSVRISKGKDPVGTITIRAERERGRVIITCDDDGRGLDPQQIRDTASARGLYTSEELAQISDSEVLYLIMRPGFTTAKKVTALSGRGVGMDVVKINVEKLKGTVEIASEVGKRTRFRLIMPLSLSLMNVLLVECEGHIFGIPTSNVADAELVKPEQDIFTEGGIETVDHAGRMIPLFSLADVVGLPKRENRFQVGRLRVVFVGHREQQMAFVVDDLLEQEKVVLESRGRALARFPLVAGASILGNGDACLILDVPELFRAASRAGSAGAGVMAEIKTRKQSRKRRILLVEDSLTTRTMEKSILESFGYVVDAAASGVEALTKLTEDPHDLVVTDIQMPEMDGFSLVAQLRRDRRYERVPVVVVSSFQDEGTQRRAAELGVASFISKGTFQQSQLLGAVQGLLLRASGGGDDREF